MRMLVVLIAVLASSPSAASAQTAVCKTGNCSYQNMYTLPSAVPSAAPAFSSVAPAPAASPACPNGQCSNTAYQYPYYQATPSYPVASPTPRTVVSQPAVKPPSWHWINGFWYWY